MGRHAIILLLLIAGIGCAARSPAGAPTGERARADQLVRDGCYDCLLEARAVYGTLAESRHPAVLLTRLEIELLIALREKELALDAEATLARAEAIGALLQPRVDVGPYLRLVRAIPPDAAGTPRSGRPVLPLLAGREGLASAVAAIDASPFSPIVRQYLATALQCGRPPLTADAGATPAVLPAAPPLLHYRRAICASPVDRLALEEIRTAVPRFTEAALFLGRAAMATLIGTDGATPRGLFEEAYARFPDSPAVTFHLGTVHQATGDCRAGERYFGETLVLRPDHEDARLGRAVCRTYLADAAGAIDDATTLIDAEAYNRADAYYWRAWNHWRQKRLDTARADVDRSRALMYNARVLTLAGMIEHDQREFDQARDDLTRARDMDVRECQARWYLALVGFGTEAWRESAAAFADAADCYARLIVETEAQRQAMAARDDVSEEFRARQLSGFDAAIAEDRSQKSAADLNAAINYARAQDVDSATVYMKRAALDPERRVAVEDLRQVLGVPRW